MVEADHDPYDYQEPARILLDRLIQRIPALASMPDSQAFNLRIGVRPYPNDGMSFAGAFPGAEGLYLAVTHSGVTLAPALANLMTELMQTGKTPAALKPFALDRYPGFGA